MPETFPVADPNSGELVETRHYSVDEVAAMLHVHASTVHRLMRRDRWPHLAVANRVWFAEHDVTAALHKMRRNDDREPESEPGPLGLVLPDDDEDGDPDPGGIR